MVSNSTIKLLRIPFSFFLSPIYLFALAQVTDIHWPKAVLVFFIIHFLVYPASNGYNSYMDRDTGPIGGLEKPPPASRELYLLTIFLDCLAMVLSILVHPLFAAAMVGYIGASKAYSYRGIRLKKYAVTGYLIVIIFQGAVTFWLVYFGSSVSPDPFAVPWMGMIICALLVGGFYPLTQIYQHQQDLDDGIRTISYKLGYRGTFLFCALVYTLAWVFMAQFFIRTGQAGRLWLPGIFFIPVIVYFIGWWKKVWITETAANFRNTMRMNWLAAACTNAAFLILLIWRWIE
jgi:1,4-dihydroxy-2-naphthoate polyprenyltransferase